MNIVAWILVGLTSGMIAGQAASCAKLGVMGNVALAITSVVVVGALLDFWAGGVEATHVQFWSMFAAMTVAVIVLVTRDERMIRLQARRQRRTS